MVQSSRRSGFDCLKRPASYELQVGYSFQGSRRQIGCIHTAREDTACTVAAKNTTYNSEQLTSDRVVEINASTVPVVERPSGKGDHPDVSSERLIDASIKADDHSMVLGREVRHANKKHKNVQGPVATSSQHDSSKHDEYDRCVLPDKVAPITIFQAMASSDTLVKPSSKARTEQRQDFTPLRLVFEDFYETTNHQETRPTTTVPYADPDLKTVGSSNTYHYSMSQELCVSITLLLQQLHQEGLPDRLDTRSNQLSRSARSKAAPVRTREELQTLSKQYKRNDRGRKHDRDYQSLLQERSKLPMQQHVYQERLMSYIQENDVVIVVSATGSGKTTQIPQLILDWAIADGSGAFCNVICTQPRRLAATSIAKRVAREQRSEVGGHVGFSVRFSKALPQQPGSIAYYTTGSFLRVLYDDPESFLQKYSHIIIDEVHERDAQTELVLLILRDLMRTYRIGNKPFPKIILMSATIDALEFQRYFAEKFQDYAPKVASIEVPGRSFGIEQHFLDDFTLDLERQARKGGATHLIQKSSEWIQHERNFTGREPPESVVEPKQGNLDFAQANQEKSNGIVSVQQESEIVPIGLICLMIAYILKTFDTGDILVFLPGLGEIASTQKTLVLQPLLGTNFNDAAKIRIFKLHAALHGTNDEVFEPIPAGCRRIVLATNIAQTSITLPDIAHVIDSGKHRQMAYNSENRIHRFLCTWIDKASAKQREGRAGRTAPGHYWALFTKARYESLESQKSPELLSSKLTSICLGINAYLGAKPLSSFFSRALNKPGQQAIDSAVEELRRLRMISDDEEITPLGRIAASFPLEAATARMLILGVLFRCLRPLLLIASHNPDNPLLHSDTSVRTQIRNRIRFSKAENDDRFSLLTAFETFNAAVNRGLKEEIEKLKQESVRDNAYMEMMNSGRQLSNLLHFYGFAIPIPDASTNPFNSIPADLNENSSSTALIKGLGLTMQQSNLAVWNSRGCAWHAEQLISFLRPSSINARTALKQMNRWQQRSNGELLSYRSSVYVPINKLPYLNDTSAISPLMAMLFGGSMGLSDKNIVHINGWLRYRVTVDPSSTDTAFSDQDATQLILELRRALDRFIQLACSQLQDQQHKKQQGLGTETSCSSEQDLFHESNLVRRIFTDGLRQVLEEDADHWRDFVYRSSPSRTQDTATD